MPTPLKGADLSDFALRVIAWQRRHGRHGLPWQGTRDAYRIWLSEIMLQQTQVSTVLGYYDAFLRRFPTVADLAAAPVDDVLAAWSGLGYYSRARNLHRCAQQVMALHAGVFPTRSDLLEALPGIGRSTAAAIAAFSAGERAAILDGNVQRVLGRVLAWADDLAQPRSVKALWSRAEALLPESGIEPYTQGLMDLGATLCTRRKPQCLLCPVHDLCAAAQRGEPEAYPVKIRRLKRSARTSALWLALRHGPPVDAEAALPVTQDGQAVQTGESSQCGQTGQTGQSRQTEGQGKAAVRTWVLLLRRPPKGIWAGLWAPPLVDALEDLQQALSDAALGGPTHVLPAVVHALTHLDWTLQPLRHTVSPAASPAAVQRVLKALDLADADCRWWSVEQALQLGLPAPVRRLLEDLDPR